MAKKQESRYEELAKNITKGKYTRFNSDYHPSLLLQIFDSGGDSWDFCAEAKVGRSTFHDWVKRHESFGQCYDVAKALAYKAVMKDPRWQDPQNFPAYRLMMKNRFDYTEQRKVRLTDLDENASIQEQYKTLVKYVKDGALSTHEMGQIAGMLLAAIKIDEHTNLTKRLEEAEKAIQSKL